MIDGVHALLFCRDAAATRAFFRDVMELESLDEGDGWIYLVLPPAELACHPGDPGAEIPAGGVTELYLMCKDVEATRSRLEEKGVEFTMPVVDAGWGLMTRMKVPGFGEMGFYQPKHASPLQAFSQ